MKGLSVAEKGTLKLEDMIVNESSKRAEYVSESTKTEGRICGCGRGQSGKVQSGAHVYERLFNSRPPPPIPLLVCQFSSLSSSKQWLAAHSVRRRRQDLRPLASQTRLSTMNPCRPNYCPPRLVQVHHPIRREMPRIHHLETRQSANGRIVRNVLTVCRHSSTICTMVSPSSISSGTTLIALCRPYRCPQVKLHL